MVGDVQAKRADSPDEFDLSSNLDALSLKEAAYFCEPPFHPDAGNEDLSRFHGTLYLVTSGTKVGVFTSW